MGSLCCCFSRKSDDSSIELNNTRQKEETNDSVSCKCGFIGSNVKLTRNTDKGSYVVEGTGIAIGSCPLDCDTAYFEVKVGKNPIDTRIGMIRFNKKNPCDMNITLDKLESDSSAWYFKGLELKEGDVIGIHWDQTDLPMVSFTVNGVDTPTSSINRIRPAQEIFPAVSVINGSAEFIFEDKHFVFKPKNKKFSMIVCATSLI
eukprot:gene21464-27802_t